MRLRRALVLAPALCAALASPLAAQDAAEPWSDLAANRNRLLLHVHGGGYVLSPGEAGTREAVLMAGYGGFRIVSVDYRCRPTRPILRRSTTRWRCTGS